MGSHWKVLIDYNTCGKSLIRTRTEHPEQLNDPLLAEQFDDLPLAEQLVDPPLANQLDDPPFAEHLNDPLDLRWTAWWSAIIWGKKIYVGEKVFNKNFKIK